jgi:hypothetical protein
MGEHHRMTAAGRRANEINALERPPRSAARHHRKNHRTNTFNGFGSLVWTAAGTIYLARARRSRKSPFRP